MRPDRRVIVLDVHGVIFTNPLVPFLAEQAPRFGRPSAEVVAAWTSRLRRPFWLGRLGVEEMWASLLPGADPDRLTRELEERYAPGPILDALDEIPDPMWLLSNHRSEWLGPRLERFGLADRFERVYVSDHIGWVKPDVGAFRFVAERTGGRRVLYVDDKPLNVAAAASVFEQSIHVDDRAALPRRRDGAKVTRMSSTR